MFKLLNKIVAFYAPMATNREKNLTFEPYRCRFRFRKRPKMACLKLRIWALVFPFIQVSLNEKGFAGGFKSFEIGTYLL